MKHRLFTRTVGLMLVLALAVGSLPAGALAAVEPAGVQSGTVQEEKAESEAAQSAAQEFAGSEAAQSASPELAASEAAQSAAQEAAASEAAVSEAMAGSQTESALPEAPLPAPEAAASSAPSQAAEAQPTLPPEAAHEELPPTEENALSVQSVTIPLEPDSFTCTMQFYANGELVSEQILSAGENPIEPPCPLQKNAVFEGWFDENGNACDFSQPVGALSENQTIVYTARMRQSYTVYYFSEPAGGAVLFTQTYETKTETVHWQQVAFAAPAGMALAGWSLTPGGEAVQTPALGEEPLCLYPVLVKAWWITLDGKGGAAPDPVYVLPGQGAPEIKAAERTGYRFTGWFTDEECTQSYAPGTLVNADLKLYAGWEAQQVGYRVAYWQQNPDDDGYSLAEVEQGTALADASVQLNPDKDRYANFTQREKPAAQTIAGDGCTVIPVYYDRSIYTVKFYRGNTEIEQLRITARYGANIADKWPSVVDSKWPNLWRTSRTGTQYQNGIVTMPAPGDQNNPNQFYYAAESGRYTLEWRYYTETVQGGRWELHHTDSFKDDSTRWKLTQNDLYAIKGFTVNKSKNPKVGAYAQRLDSGAYGFELYYDREDYEIQFYNAGELDKTVTLAYEAPLTAQRYTPKHPSDSEMVFAGWYSNHLGQGEPFDFSGTMPAGSFALYALWKEPTYRVSFDLAGGSAAEGSDFDDQIVKRGELARQPGSEPVREGWRFLGWKCGEEPFSFVTPIRKDTKLVAMWVSENSYTLRYEPGEGSGNAFAETRKFGEGTGVQLAVPPAEWKCPQGCTGFLGWSVADENGTLLQPGELLTMPGRDTVLVAQWGPARQTQLVYDYQGGTDEAGNSEKTVPIENPNEDYTIEALRVQREGYLFAGWSTQPAEGTLLQAGDVIRVNTLQPETNRLYARWEKAVITEVRLVVEGNLGERERDFAFNARMPAGSTGSFTLRHSGSYVFEAIPESAGKIAVQQEDVTQDGYTTTMREETQDGRRILTFTNVREGTVPTGLRQQSLPAALALGMGMAITGAVLLRRRS